MMWMVWAHILLIVIYLALYKVKRVEHKLRRYLYWNCLIRLYMEVFKDMALLTVLNMHTVNWDSPHASVIFSNYVALLILLLIGLLPPVFLIFFCCKKDKWQNKGF